MHTRTTAKILAGAAMAALAGCVAVDAPPHAPAPAPTPAASANAVRPAQGGAPQIVEGPAREALEAALPPVPSAPRNTPSVRPAPRAAQPPRAEAPRPDPVPRRPERPGRPAPGRPALPDPPQRPATLPPIAPPVSRAEVCALGERYGGWAPGSDQARICRGS
ncbi:hypothetical protein [Streptomyces sp. NPDC058855]|uniref:hypothetical protein n=1 Tax=Streptomyces sp. NPDC058855 TaxID=3346651 RepID=UPI00367908D6